jgi:hypothetical protein
MIVDVEPTPGRPGRWNADCGAHHVTAVRTPLLSMARKLLEAGYDPALELRMTHRGAKTISMRVKLGDAAKIWIVKERRNGPRFAKYHASSRIGEYAVKAPEDAPAAVWGPG